MKILFYLCISKQGERVCKVFWGNEKFFEKKLSKTCIYQKVYIPLHSQSVKIVSGLWKGSKIFFEKKLSKIW